MSGGGYGRELSLVPATAPTTRPIGTDPAVERDDGEAKKSRQLEEYEAKLKFISDVVPTKTINVQGSAAGAGSSTINIYRKIKIAEEQRWKRVEEEHIRREESEAYEIRKRKREEEDAAKLEKNRAKREKRKSKKSSSASKKKSNNSNSNSNSNSIDRTTACEINVPQVDDLD